MARFEKGNKIGPRFAKGQSGNPSGRSGAAQRTQAELEREFEKFSKRSKASIEKRMQRLDKLKPMEIMILALYQNATGGKRRDGVFVPSETAAIKEMFDRLAGKSRQPIVGDDDADPIRVVPKITPAMLKKVADKVDEEV